MPSGRTNLYATYRACERFNLQPPNVKAAWDDNTNCVKSLLLAYSQIRDVEDAQKCVSPL